MAQSSAVAPTPPASGVAAAAGAGGVDGDIGTVTALRRAGCAAPVKLKRVAKGLVGTLRLAACVHDLGGAVALLRYRCLK